MMMEYGKKGEVIRVNIYSNLEPFVLKTPFLENSDRVRGTCDAAGDLKLYSSSSMFQFTRRVNHMDFFYV